MQLLVYARPELIDRSHAAGAADGRVGPIAGRDTALLLEGRWPPDAPFGRCQSLDELIDGRFDWIDEQAAELAESLGMGTVPIFATAKTGPSPSTPGGPPGDLSVAHLGALALRYYLVKLIRPLAYLTELHPLGRGGSLELVAAAWRDQDYADLFSQYCRAAGVGCRVRWVEGSPPPDVAFPPNRRWRRCLGQLAQRLQPAVGPRSLGRRVVLCGNPCLLEPVGRELLSRGCQLWWLVDRFAVGLWRRWRKMGVGQLVCNASLGQDNALATAVPGPLLCRGVDLAVPVGRWLAQQAAMRGPRLTRLLEQIDGHLGRVRPEAVVLDEDATPLARATVAMARRHGARSLVVQHGVPYCRFGFAPLSADRILVWGDSSRERLIEWGVSPERIGVVGSPQHDGVSRPLGDHGLVPFDVGRPLTSRERPAALDRRRPPRILLLATVPPRDERPDAAALHLTAETYARMLHMAVAVVAEVDGAELVVRPHPRATADPVLRAILAGHPSLRVRWAARGRLQSWLAGVDCALSCGSTAGVEATLAGLPVVQLAPPGASGFLADDPWGLAGTARNATQLRDLLTRLAADGWPAPASPESNVFAALGAAAAARTADEVLDGSRAVKPRPILAVVGGDSSRRWAAK